MAEYRVTAEEALQHLVRVSQRTNTTLSEVARNLMASITQDR
nr:ANTAR domain-containing protein [Rhodococcus wratislaviensis]